MTSLILLSLAPLGCDGNGDTGEATAAATANSAPEADAGSDVSVSGSEVVQLDGRGSYDPDGDALTYHWSFDSAPEGSDFAPSEQEARSSNGGLTPNDSASASTTAFVPDAVGTYLVRLVVNDGQDDSDPDFVTVVVEEPSTLPVANAGADQTVAVGGTAVLDGSGSYDPNGLDLGYTWTVVSVPDGSTVNAGALSGADAESASFTVDKKGDYMLSLVVDNGLAESVADSVTITGLGTDTEPVADAGGDMSAEDCTDIQLDGSGSSDPDGDALEYFWEVQSVPSGSSATNDNFSDRTAEKPTFWADIAGTYIMSLTVSDGTAWSVLDNITLTVGERSSNSAPSVNVGALATVSAGNTECTEDAYGYDCEECAAVNTTIGDTIVITDPDGDPTTVLWEVSSGDAVISDATELVTTISLEGAEATEPDICDENAFDLLLYVTDCPGATTTTTVTVTAECCGTAGSGKGK